jgi:biopolymer transport protein ExbD
MAGPRDPRTPTRPPAEPALSKEELARQDAQRKYRRERRKARERAGEIKELNITAMMDMMTIILVFLLKSYQASALNVNQTEALKLPASSTQIKPQDNINITISLNEIAVNDKVAVKLGTGVIPAAMKQDGKADSFYVESIYALLKQQVDKQKLIAQYNSKMPFSGRVNIIADRRIPYRTLMEILYTAGQAELGEYKFMTLKND